MLFNSYVFLFAFLPIVLLGWWVVFRGERSRLAWITLASFVFYSWFEFPTGLKLLPLLLISTSADYVAGRYIDRATDPRVRRRWLIGALSINLGMLFWFKYMGFFGGVLNTFVALSGAEGQVPIRELVLPIGISFYTFNSMSYTIDIYRRRARPAASLLHYSAFVSLFPHLVAGPIVRYTDIEAQLHALKSRLTSKLVVLGVFFFVCGLTKKLVVADTLAPTVDRLYALDGSLSMVSGWAAAVGYSMQMYFDFSGYSDMAVGLALLLGLRFPQNFNSPYKATDIAEFWRRWHITLSRWMRDYLFIPLGGSNGSTLFTARNLFITMLLGGLWHGAAWTFVVFGLLQGLLLGLHALWRERGWPSPPRGIARLLTYLSFAVPLVCFRAPDMSAAINVWQAMLGVNGVGLDDLTRSLASGTSVPLLFVLQLVAVVLWVNLAPNTFEYRLRPTRRSAVVLGFAFSVCVLLLAAPSPFLYFQF
jgi:alginate O-acetyltransferase complex protein AlgI